ncbi:hypothetical protein BDN72DRAFT_822011 [Pluteus cervinus]|uniref:Uncharacterized protein n=1 Tax=Pluteus cervinus TaxID=181527 RepID=A0ACD3AQ01_9AGAR|nr:hypothetical protein BDN72DRAFT_822011 [Pluteus cervinus]
MGTFFHFTCTFHSPLVNVAVDQINALKPCCGRVLTQVDSNGQPLAPLSSKLRAPDISVYFKTPSFLRTAYDFKKVELSIELRQNDADDPFDDDGESFHRVGDAAKATLAQLFLYATAHFASQFRTHVFSVLVLPTYARLLRWDRNGVIVTEKIDLEHTNIIPQFFGRLQYTTTRIRGLDETIRPAVLTVAQGKAIRKALNVGPKVTLLQVDVAGRTFILPELLSTTRKLDSPFGRQTACFRVYDPVQKKCFFAKDTWRIWTPVQKAEHEILERLLSKGVKHIPILECGGDIDPTGGTHQTISEDFMEMVWSKCAWRATHTYRHYRIVLEELQGHVSECKIIKQVVVVMRDAAEAHAQAYEEVQIVHRDVSEANIMFRQDGDKLEGVLIDWDLCEELGRGYNGGRTGTWYFLAARLMDKDLAPERQDRIDDIESFFHVLVYIATHYTRHQMDPTELFNFVEVYFLQMTIIDGEEYGGMGKTHFFTHRGQRFFQRLQHQPLQDLLRELVEPLAARYDLHPRSNKDRDIAKDGKEEKNPLQTLEDPFWFSKTLTRALERLDGWDKNGELVEQVESLSQCDETEGVQGYCEHQPSAQPTATISKRKRPPGGRVKQDRKSSDRKKQRQGGV